MLSKMTKVSKLMLIGLCLAFLYGRAKLLLAGADFSVVMIFDIWMFSMIILSAVLHSFLTLNDEIKELKVSRKEAV